MKLIWSNGLLIENQGERITVDPQNKFSKSNLTLISHAHIDHIQGVNGETSILSSKETYEILKLRTPQPVNHIPLSQRQLYESSGFKITPYNSGHVLGSFQFFIESDTKSILYSSDINCVKSLTTPPAESLEADILILESTYGRPEYSLPPREEVYAEIIEWCVKTLGEGRIPVFKAYALGKSQELIKLMNSYLHIPVIVDSEIAFISEVYNKNGVKLNFISQHREEAQSLLKEKFCILILSSFKNSGLLFDRRSFELAFASGWALKFKPKYCSAAFPLSSHADYYQLLSFVEACAPKKVYTCHGFAHDLAKAIESKLNVEAQPISEVGQRKLLDF